MNPTSVSIPLTAHDHEAINTARDKRDRKALAWIAANPDSSQREAARNSTHASLIDPVNEFVEIAPPLDFYPEPTPIL